MAAKEKVWIFEAQGVPYKIELKKNKVSVNGDEPVKLNKLTVKSSFWETSYSMTIEGKEAAIHIRSFGAPILSYDGRDCATGEAYVPTKVPVWAWIFIVLHAADFFFLIGGAIGGGLQALIIAALVAVASNKKKPIVVRVLLCTVIWLLSTIVQFFLRGLINELYLQMM